MYRRFRRASLALISAVAAPLGAQQPAPEGPLAPIPALTVTGTGKVKLSPDRATVVVAVETHGASAAAAAADNARRVKAALDTVQKLGLGRDQLSTSGYAVTPEYRYDRTSSTTRVVGYTARNGVRVDVRKLEQLGPIIDAALAGGANTIGDVELSASNADEARRAALTAAVQKAQGDAEAMAHAAGGGLGPLLELSSTQSEGGIGPMFAARVATAAPGGNVPTNIEPGDITVSVSVTGKWEFLENRK